MLVSKYFAVKFACNSKLLRCDLNTTEDVLLTDSLEEKN